MGNNLPLANFLAGVDVQDYFHGKNSFLPVNRNFNTQPPTQKLKAKKNVASNLTCGSTKVANIIIIKEKMKIINPDQWRTIPSLFTIPFNNSIKIHPHYPNLFPCDSLS